MTSHTETILCPECWQECVATVEHTIPFYTYIHLCLCGYTITESDWQKVNGKLEHSLD